MHRILIISYFLSVTIGLSAQLQPLLQPIQLRSYPGTQSISSTSNLATINAAGESGTFIGRLYTTGNSGSKTISAAGGGSLRWRVNTITWADAATVIRIGIQDVTSASGIEDGTFDVYADIDPVSDAMSSNSAVEHVMESGTKTMSAGDLIAISIEMTARGGSDQVIIGYSTATGSITGYNFPYGTADTGSGPAKLAAYAGGITIEFDDGTIGWICPTQSWQNGVGSSSTTSAFHANSTPDEYGAAFRVPFKCSIHTAMLSIGSIATTDNFEFVLYQDGLGTPAAMETVTWDPDYTASASASAMMVNEWTSDHTLYPNVWYVVSARPTVTSGGITFAYFDLGSGNEKYKSGSDFGLDVKMVSRSNQTGAFSEVQTYYLPIFQIGVTALDNGKRERSSSF